MNRKVLIINYFLFIGGGEKLLIELVKFCLENGIQPEVLIPERIIAGDNKKEEFYDNFLKKRGVKVHRVPVFFKAYNFDIFKYWYWQFKLNNSDKFYDSVHVLNLNLCDSIYEKLKNKNRYFWHIVNRVQFEGKKYPYRQRLVSNPNDNIIVINKYQVKEMQEYFYRISSKVLNFKLFLNN
ncbi:hypothetical protein AAE02nite_08890 [Adhaeribacter aerolatus]|uniref:Glycosyltransferase subfamily 4-like N-terminal domain-containing protein n=1 Tax=Adhaeribacter aerolatus TaxID=670289 RepID=A0A512AU35_9BACT|nr:glycosyltransferase [Adhaeribacter aerolatus]GEO03225.1 hypothetical protein AAE02nite_08890 [Adhaeribacter aerolatus]